MKKFATLLILSMAILFTFNVSKGCESMATTKMYDTKGNLVDVDRNQQDSLLSQGYSFKKPTAPTNTGGSTTLSSGTSNPNDLAFNAIKAALSFGNSIAGAFGMGLPSGLAKSQDDAITSAYNQVTQPDRTAQAPITDPYAEALAQYQAEQQRLAEAQRQSRIAGLGKARDNALSGLDAEKGTIDPYYYDKRNEAASASDVGAMNFAQFMAGRGIKGSAGAMPEMYRNAGLQSQIGGLDRQQAAEHSDIARRRSGIQSAYESDVAGANADIDAQTMQNYINQMQTVQAQRIADLAAQGKTSTGQLNLQGQNAQNSEYERQAALIAAQYYDDIKAEIDRRAAANPNDPLIPYLYSARQQKIQTQAEQKAAAMAAASEAEQQTWTNAFKLFESNGRITSAEQAQILGLPTNATVADVDIARMNAATSRMNATKPVAQPEPNTLGPSDYKTNPDFAEEVAFINSNPAMALATIQQNATALIQKYGYDGYNELLRQATPKE